MTSSITPNTFLPAMRAVIHSAICLFFAVGNVSGQNPTFNCGSNGSYGPMNITASTTLQLPPDGVFHCTTVNVASGIVLRFSRNAQNTPVYILATGDVTLDGQIHVDAGGSQLGNAPGLGGPGGFDGGTGSNELNVPAGPGMGPGGGGRGVYSAAQNEQATTHAGNGAYKSSIVGNEPYGQAGSVYGNSLLIPLVGGSGGGGLHLPGFAGNLGGGGGGGAILLASNTRILFGGDSFINANGLGGWSYATKGQISRHVSVGSGGAIRVVSPKVMGTFGGSVITSAGSTNFRTGRIRFDSFDASEIIFRANSAPDSIGSVMVVFPTPLPKLSISNATGTAVAENVVGPVSVILPAGTNPSQTIQVRARDFGSVVPIRVRLVPESGDATTFDATIDNTVNNPATTNVPVTLPINTGVRIEVFTR
jgi:hypothetical protein